MRVFLKRHCRDLRGVSLFGDKRFLIYRERSTNYKSRQSLLFQAHFQLSTQIFRASFVLRSLCWWLLNLPLDLQPTSYPDSDVLYHKSRYSLHLVFVSRISDKAMKHQLREFNWLTSLVVISLSNLFLWFRDSYVEVCWWFLLNCLREGDRHSAVAHDLASIFAMTFVIHVTSRKSQWTWSY